MAIVFTSAITVPNIPRATLVRCRLFDNSAALDYELRNNTAGRTKAVTVWARNTVDGKCDVLQANPTPVAFDDDVRVNPAALTSATAADQIEVAYRTGANKAAALRAVEQKCIDLGMVTIAGTVQ
jgi:hypothetical protein